VDSGKRAWAYEGLALADGMGLVSCLAEVMAARPTQGLGDWRLVLFGDELAMGLSTPLAQLAIDHVDFVWLGRKGTSPADWCGEWVAMFLAAVPAPAVYLAAFRWPQAAPPLGVMAAIEQQVGAAGARLVWLAPPAAQLGAGSDKLVLPGVHVLDSADFDVQLGPPGPNGRQDPTTVGYAAWAGAVWAWLV
jgi:hypothetical protein